MESSLAARLDAYPDLSPGERAGLRTLIEADRPDLRPALEEAEAFARLLGALRHGGEQGGLAELAAAQATGTGSASDAALWARLEARAEADADLRGRLEAVRGRVAVLGGALGDPRARFEQLTAAAKAPAARPETVPASRRGAGVRGPVARERGRPAGWGRVLAASAALVVLVVGLRAALRPSPYAFTAGEVGTAEFGALRGGVEQGADPTDTLYLYALDELAQARRSFLGLPFGTDRTRLIAAEQHLGRVVAASPPGSFVHLEAAYRLAKARLLLGDAAAARPLLTEVVEGQGRYAPEAEALLERSASGP